MRWLERLSGVVYQGDPGLQGRVSGGNHDKTHIARKKDLLKLLPTQTEQEIQADSTDHFPRYRFRGNNISYENAAAYDEGRSDYEAGQDMTGHEGVLPCDLVGRPRDPKLGVSLKRRWDR